MKILDDASLYAVSDAFEVELAIRRRGRSGRGDPGKDTGGERVSGRRRRFGELRLLMRSVLNATKTSGRIAGEIEARSARRCNAKQTGPIDDPEPCAVARGRLPKALRHCSDVMNASTSWRTARPLATAFASIVVLGSVVMAMTGCESSTTEAEDRTNCEDWNTEGYFENATANGVADCLRRGADVHDRNADGLTPLFLAAGLTSDPGTIGVLVRAGADANERVAIKGRVATPLFLATERRDGVGAVLALLGAGADANARGHEGWSALHVAAAAGRWEAAALLLEHGAEVPARDDAGITPLGAAAKRLGVEANQHGRVANAVSVIRILLKNGADAGELTGRGWTDLHRTALLGDVGAVVKIIADQGLDANARTRSGWAALHLAAFGGEDPGVVTALLNAGAEPNARFGDGRTPLHCAAFRNPNPLVIKALVDGGADPNAGTTTGWTPLHAAAYANRNPEVLAMLSSGGGDANARILRTWTERELFPKAYRSTLAPEAQTPSDLSFSPLTLDGRPQLLNGLSAPLHVAVDFPRNPSAVPALIVAGSDPNARDLRGETPLHHVEVSADVVTLVAAGADAMARDEDGYTPLHNAVRRATRSGNLALVTTLIDHGADPNAASESGWTPLHAAAIGGSDANGDLVSLLIRHGGDPTARDAFGTTPLHRAADYKDANRFVIDALVKGGADPNARDAKGETPLFKAAAPFMHPQVASNHLIVAQLIEAGADPNLRNGTGRTPLHAALAKLSGAPVVDALLDGGADGAHADDEGLTPWDIAQKHKALRGTPTFWRLNDARFD